MAKNESNKEILNKFRHHHLILRGTLGLTCFVIAFGLFFSYATVRGDVVRILVALFGVLVLIMCLGMIAKYAWKVVCLENDTQVQRFTAILAVNTFFGLVIPLWFIQKVSDSVIWLFANTTNFGTFLCQIRFGIVNYYYQNRVYFMIKDLVWITLVTSILIFVLGGIVEKFWKK